MSSAADSGNDLDSGPNEETSGPKPPRWTRYAPIIGSFGFGVVTAAVDYFFPAPGFSRSDWQSEFPYIFAISVSIFIGSMFGGAVGEAGEFAVNGRYREAAETCLRWALAGAALFLLGPIANFDQFVYHPLAGYIGEFRQYAPCVIGVVVLFVMTGTYARHRRSASA